MILVYFMDLLVLFCPSIVWSNFVQEQCNAKLNLLIRENQVLRDRLSEAGISLADVELMPMKEANQPVR